MNNRSDILDSLNFDSTLGEIIRVLYSIALDYCVLRSIEREKIVRISKDQLVALLGRGYSDNKAEDLFEFAENQSFKPLSPEELADELDKEGANMETQTQNKVLVITEECGRIMKCSEANAKIEPEYPEWWEIPLPLAMLFRGEILINRTADGLPISKALLHIKTGSLPVKQNEFFVTLKDKKKSHSVLFKHLDKRVYLIDDVTQDVETADDIVWWASVGKAFASKIESEGKIIVRDGEDTAQFEPEDEVLCDWDGKNIGKLIIGHKKEPPVKTTKRTRKK